MPCYCSNCYPSSRKGLTRRTIQLHLQKDETLLIGETSRYALFLQGCIDRNVAFLATGLNQVVLKTSGSDEGGDTGSDSDISSSEKPGTQPGLAAELDPSSRPEGDIEGRFPDEWDTLEGGTSLYEMDVDQTIPIADQVHPEDDSGSESDDSVDLVSQEWWQQSSETPEYFDPEMDLDSDGDDSGGDSDPEMDPKIPEDEAFLKLPQVVEALRQKLKGNYVVPPPPNSPPIFRALEQSELHSLRHYAAWIRSNGTIKAYKEHGLVLAAAAGVPILTIHKAKKLAAELTKFVPLEVDMCPRSCIAYTGDHVNLTHCPYTPPKGRQCNTPRYRHTSSGRLKAQATVKIMSPMATIRAMYAGAETSRHLRSRDSALQKALLLVGSATRRFSDFGNSQVHVEIHHQTLGLFQDSRDVAFAISTDGAQLTLKKQSNTWILLLIILNLPSAIRYQTNNIIINFATPGPNSPGEIETFAWPLFEEMAMASEGIWIWDAIDSSYFLNRAAVAMALGDMLGSAKLSGMAGHMAIRGDRFSTVQGAKASTDKGSKSQYYPLSPPQNSVYNPTRKPSYNPLDLPMRTQQSYWETITQLDNAKTKKDETDLTRKTGVSRLPLCAASPAFVHPTFFPLDPFHLFYENCMAFFWDAWTTLSHPSEAVHIPAATARKIGTLIPPAMATLPSSFCGPVRDVFLKRNSQYKVYEWMAILHWYLVPIGIELFLDPSMLRNFSRFVQVIEFSMTVAPRSEEDLQQLQRLIATFLEDYERLYIGNDPSKIIRARLCIFQLNHIPIHIQWYGSIRLGSQGTVERTIGEMGHKIRSKKEPFSNLANLIYQRELVKILSIYYPEIIPTPPAAPLSNEPKLIQHHRIAWTKSLPRKLVEDLPKLSSYLGTNLPNPDVTLSRWGKLKLANGDVLQSQLSENHSIRSTGRRSIWFEALSSIESGSGSGDTIQAKKANLCFGEALAFYRVEEKSVVKMLVVFIPFVEIESMFGVVWGVQAGHVQVMDVSRIQAIVGIWAGVNTGKMYILRKHPGLEYLTLDERGLDEEQMVEDEED